MTPLIYLVALLWLGLLWFVAIYGRRIAALEAKAEISGRLLDGINLKLLGPDKVVLAEPAPSGPLFVEPLDEELRHRFGPQGEPCFRCGLTVDDLLRLPRVPSCEARPA